MSLSVIVGRFQLDEPHEGHKALMRHAAEKGNHLLVVVGQSALPSTRNNPMPADVRRAMISEFLNFEDIPHNVAVLRDIPSDILWSENLDEIIETELAASDEVEAILYHGRDSFAAHYTGTFPVEEIPEHENHTASQRRAGIGQNPGPAMATREFRCGMIYAQQLPFPTVYGCVDAAVVCFNEHGEAEVLVIRKHGVTGFMFPGGFNDPKANSEEIDTLIEQFGYESGTDEFDALREVFEETTVLATNPRYLGSFTQDDSRYRPEVDEIRTRLFVCDYAGGEAKGGDDAAWAGWIGLEDLNRYDFNPSHHDLVDRVIKWYSEGK